MRIRGPGSKIAVLGAAVVLLFLVATFWRGFGYRAGSVATGSPGDGPGGVVEVLEHAQRVLWIGAHPDDENVAGALIARAADVAGAVFMVSLTRGENSHITWGGLCRGSQIGVARAALFARAAALFGADGYELGPFVNGPHSLAALDAQCPPGAPFTGWPPTATSEDVIAKWEREGDPLGYIVGLLRRWQPDVVVAMDGYCGVSGHPEHIAVARLLEQAVSSAADPAAYPELGPPWQVRHLVFSAHVIPSLVECGYCKCEGPPPDEPVEEVLSLDVSGAHGVTYFRVACRVAKTYQNAMEERGWSGEQIEAQCVTAEADAQEAYRNGARGFPIFEPFRDVRQWGGDVFLPLVVR